MWKVLPFLVVGFLIVAALIGSLSYSNRRPIRRVARACFRSDRFCYRTPLLGVSGSRAKPAIHIPQQGPRHRWRSAPAVCHSRGVFASTTPCPLSRGVGENEFFAVVVAYDVVVRLRFRQRKVAGSGGLSLLSHQPPYDQDDYDQNSNLINVTHGIATFSSALDAPNPLRPGA